VTEQRVDGWQVVELGKIGPNDLSIEKLMSCFFEPPVRFGGGKYGFGLIGPAAESKAATRIQSA
jgi:hypothetical protein